MCDCLTCGAWAPCDLGSGCPNDACPACRVAAACRVADHDLVEDAPTPVSRVEACETAVERALAALDRCERRRLDLLETLGEARRQCDALAAWSASRAEGR